MNTPKSVKRPSSMTFCTLIVAGFVGGISLAQADAIADQNVETARVRRGFEIAPVPLNLRQKDRTLGGLGSYLVNAVGGCNGCHSAAPATGHAAGGKPRVNANPPQHLNQARALAGGRERGPV